MQRLTFRTGLFFAVDLALIVVCFLHVPSLLNRPRPPFDLTETNDRVVVEKIVDQPACPELQIGDTLRSWNSQDVKNVHEVEFLSDFAAIGDTIQITFTRADFTHSTRIREIQAHDVAYILIISFVGIVAWGVGVFVLLRQSAGRAASLLHWSMVTMGVTVIMTWGQTSPDGTWMYLSRTLFFLVYASIAATFLDLTIWFPRSPASYSVLRNIAIYMPMALLAAGMIYFHVRALHERSLDIFNAFHVLFDVFHIVVVGYVGAGIVHFIRSYLQSTSSEERKKLEWVLWGLSIGPAPFFLLTTIPQYYLPFGAVPEEYTLIFLAVIPLSFGVSFIKYHLLDIEVVVNRTTVYAIVLGAVIALYIILVGTVAAFVGTHTVGTSAAAAVIVALLFEPARRRVQHVVDKKFFRVRYNFREALRRISDEIKMCVDAKQLADLLISRVDEIMPVERMGVFMLRHSDKRLFVLSHRGFEVIETRTVRLDMEKLRTPMQRPVALDSKIEPGVQYESADQRVFTRWGMALVFPMKTAMGDFVGFLVLGAKKSGERFRIEDVDLLLNVATVAGVEFERIALQRTLIEEQEENQRLITLNRMKSDFVSNVSHELRTPLTSIRMYAELLGEDGRTSMKKRRAYLDTIVGETDRLNRLVSTILDSAKIERGLKQYRFQKIDLCAILIRVLSTMKYQLDKHDFAIVYKRPRRELLIHADPDAVAEAIMNLVDNAVKFSAKKKYLKISLGQIDNLVWCAVQDRGRGISPDAIPHLFERFYRDPASSTSVQGVGLGLPIVQHIMEGHQGRVDVTSKLGAGSTFTLWFPMKLLPDEEQKENTDR